MLLRATREKNIDKSVALDKNVPRFTHSKTATTKPSPIVRALKAYILTILAVYQLQYLKTSEEGGRGFVGFAFYANCSSKGGAYGFDGLNP